MTQSVFPCMEFKHSNAINLDKPWCVCQGIYKDAERLGFMNTEVVIVINITIAMLQYKPLALYAVFYCKTHSFTG